MTTIDVLVFPQFRTRLGGTETARTINMPVPWDEQHDVSDAMPLRLTIISHEQTAFFRRPPLPQRPPSVLLPC